MSAALRTEPEGGGDSPGRSAGGRTDPEPSLAADGWPLKATLAAILLFGLLVLAVAFGAWTASSAWAFPWFVVALVVVVFMPGRALLDSLPLRRRPLDDLALSLVLGMVASSAVYWTCAWLGARLLFWLWPLGACAVAAWRWRKAQPTPLAVRGSHLALLGVGLAALLPLALIPIYYRNLARLPDGGLSYYPLGDVVFHLSFANELSHAVPPQVPFLPGTPLGYHFGVDLFVAMLGAIPGLGIPDLAVRLTPTLFVALVSLAGFCFARAWLGSELGAALFVALVFFGEDLSFVPGLLTRPDQPWAIHFFGTPTIVSLYLLNPMLPALAILFSALLCLQRCCRDEGVWWGRLAAVLFVSLSSYKVFLAVHVLVSLALAATVLWLRKGERRLGSVALLTGVLVAPLVWQLAGGPSGRFWVRPGIWPYVPGALVRCGLWPSALGQQVAGFFREGVTWLEAAALFGVALPGYLAASMGARLLGLPPLIRSLRWGGSPAERLTVAVFVLIGPLITLTWIVTPAGYPAAGAYNNAVWFSVHGKYLAWLFAVEGFLALTARGGARLRWALLAALLGLSLPSSLQYLKFQLDHARLGRIPPAAMAVIGFLQANAQPGDAVFAREELAAAVVTLTRCRATVLGVFPESFITQQELAERRRDHDRFWTSWEQGRPLRQILDRYRVRYLVAERPVGAGLPAPVFVNADYTVYDLGG